MKNLIAFLSSQRDVGLLLFRIMAGLIFVAHGLGKFSGDMAVGFFGGSLGIPIPSVAGPFVTFLEIGGGALVVLGVLTRYLGILFSIEMIVAAYVQWIVFSKGMLFTSGKAPGAEPKKLLLFAGVMLATHGAGKYSLDRMFKME